MVISATNISRRPKGLDGIVIAVHDYCAGPVDWAGARPRHWKNEFLSNMRCYPPTSNAIEISMHADVRLLIQLNIATDVDHAQRALRLSRQPMLIKRKLGR